MHCAKVGYLALFGNASLNKRVAISFTECMRTMPFTNERQLNMSSLCLIYGDLLGILWKHFDPED